MYYSAHLQGTSSLPDWLVFSNTTFTFTGAAPAKPQSHVVVVTATDVWGYSAAETSFVFAVGNGQPLEFAFGQNHTAINTTAFNNVTYKIDGVSVNGSAAQSADYSITPDLRNLKWLSFDNKTNSITGTVPESWINGTVAPISIPVTVASTNASNTLTSMDYIKMNIVPFFFTSNRLPDASSENGTTFTYNIEPFLRNKDVTVNATVDPREAASWLIYYPENYTLVGNPPANISYNSFDVAFFAVQNGVTGTAHTRVNITGGSTPPPTGTPTPVPQGTLKHDNSNIKKIIIGVCVGVGGFFILLALLLFCFCRRRGTKQDDTEGNEKTEKMDIKQTQTPRNSVLPGFGVNRNQHLLGIDALQRSPAKSATDSEMTGTTCAVTTPTTPTNKTQAEVKEGSLRRFGPIKGLFGTTNPDTEEALQSRRDLDRHGSFIGKPEPIAVRGPGDKAPVPIADTSMPLSLLSGDSLESWESPRSFHWSDEDHYLPPLMPTASGTPTPGASTGIIPDEPRTPPIAATPAPKVEATQLPGFYSRFEKNALPGEMAPFASVDDVPTSYSEFSELNHDHELSSYSINDSFRDRGSALGTMSSGFGSAGQGTFSSSRHQPTNSESSGESSSEDSGSSFHAPSGLGRFTSSSVLSAISVDEPAVVATAQRQGVLAPPAPIETMETVEAPRPLSVLAGPIMPAALPPTARRRASSSRRTTARIHATREHIVGPTTPVPQADEHLAVLGDTDDERSRSSTITRR
jgi:axial budding pattern protein 2